MRRRGHLPVAGLAIVAALALAVLLHRMGADALVGTAPLLVLLAPLLLGRYVGEDRIERLAAAVAARRAPAVARARRTSLAPRGPRALLPRGGRLIATSLAVRPPPARAAIR